MPPMPEPSTRFTYQDYLALPDDGKLYEVLDGELVLNPAPTTYHQRAVRRLLTRMSGHVEEHDLGEVFVAPTDVVLAEDQVCQPDVLFVATANLHLVERAAIMGPPDLVVEVVSPTRRRKDLIQKRSIYERHGVGEYWIVDPEVDSVLTLVREGANFVRGLDTSLADGGGTLATALLPGFGLELAALFAPGPGGKMER